MNMKVLEDGRRLWDLEDIERMLEGLRDEVTYQINDIFNFHINYINEEE